MRLVGCSTHIFVHEILESEHMAMIRQAGFSAVEIWAARPHFDYDDADQVARIASACARQGLSVVSFHGPFYHHVDDAKAGRWLTLYHEDPSVRAQALEELKKVLWTAADIGVPIVVVHWEEVGHGWDELGALLETAGEVGVRVALENSHNRSEASIETLLDVTARLGSETPAGLCFDTGHAHVAEDDLLAALSAAAPSLLAFHVHDNDGSDDAHLVPYQGNIDWTAFARSVVKLELGNKPFTLELRRYRGYMDDLMAARRAVDRMFGGAW